MSDNFEKQENDIIAKFTEYAKKQGCPDDVAEKIPAMLGAMEFQALFGDINGLTPEEINPGFFEK